MGSAVRNCFMCVHCEWNRGGDGCESCGHGGESSIKCDKGHFDHDDGYTGRQGLAADITRAETCADFKPESWAKPPLSRGEGAS